MTCSGALQLTRSSERESRISPFEPPNSVFGPVKEDPLAVDPLRQQRRVLVLGLADDAVSLNGHEVLGGREEHGRPGRPVGGARDHPALELGDAHDPRILESPELALDAPPREEERLRIDDPAVDAVGRTRGREMRDAPEILDAGQHDGGVAELRRRRVEDDVDWIRPVGGRQDRVARVTGEQLPASHAGTGWRVP